MKPLDELFKLKIVALLHDPVNKCYNIKNHKKTAEKIINIFEQRFKGIYIKDKFESEHGIYDKVASGIDRILLDKVYKEGLEKEYVPPTIFYNIFSKTFIELPKPKTGKEKYIECNSIEKFYMKLFEEIEKIIKESTITNDNKIRLFYLVLWTLLDIYYLKYVKYPLPADTRVPTHDIMDHLYSTATVCNIDKDEGGYFIYLDIAGIQKFISSSRKVRDTWISSWLISMMVWKTIEPFLIQFGPDILISPTARLNPLWIKSLCNYTNNSNLINKYRELFNLTPEEYDLILYKSSLIPPTLAFVLPINIDDSNEMKRILKCWFEINCLKNEEKEKLKEIVKILGINLGSEVNNEEDIIEKLIEELYNKNIKNRHNEEKIIKLIKLLFELNWIRVYLIFKEILKIYLLGEDQPLEKIYEILSDILPKKDLIEFLKSNLEIIESILIKPPFNLRLVIKKISLEDIKEYKNLLEYIHNLQLQKNFKSLKINNYVIKEAYELTKKAYDNDIRFEYCTCCSELPAIVVVPYDKDLYNKFLEEIYSKKKTEKGKLEATFKKGERFCPYCFIKRVISSLSDEYFIQQFSGIKVDAIKSFVPSTSDFALFDIFKNIKDIKLKDIFYNYNEIEAKNIDPKSYEWHPKVKELLNNEKNEAKKLAKILYGFQNDYEVKSEKINRFFVYVYADGDEMGNLIIGNLKEALGVNSLTEIYKNIKEVMKSYVSEDKHKENIDKIYELIFEFLKNETTTEINIKEGKITQKRIELHPITLSYHIAISRALMINSIKELKEYATKSFFESGYYIIYAGGDDLVVLSIASVENILNLINYTRKLYSLGDSDKVGFYKVGNNYIPTLGLTGRTYSVVIGHYRYPLNFITTKARNLEKTIKGIEWNLQNLTKKKDSLAIKLIKRSGSEYIAKAPFRIEPSLNENYEKAEENILRYIKVIESIWEVFKKAEHPTSLIRKYLEKDNKIIITQLLNDNRLNMLFDFINSIAEKSYKGKEFYITDKLDKPLLLTLKLNSEFWFFEIFKFLNIFNNIQVNKK